VWCAISAWRIRQPILFYETINSKYYVRLILTSFPDQLRDRDREREREGEGEEEGEGERESE
jgi:hypothetical protein